jgi:hypothetical protein
LLLGGVGCALLGLASIFRPPLVFASLRWGIGLQLVALGLLTFGPWLLGRSREGRRVHGGLPVFLQAAVATGLGAAFLSPRTVSGPVLATLVWVGLVVDGGVQLFIAFRRRWTAHLVLGMSGLLSLGIALWVAVVDRARFWAFIGPLLGVKVVVFGLALLGLAWSARDRASGVYGSAPFRFGGVRREGDAFAVYIGNAFHLGIYVGDDQVVDFRNDHRVHLCAWDDFLLGRRPVRWDYPDLEPESPGDVARFARAQAGTRRTYDFLGFNCEHFAIWCKSLGKTTGSRFAQMGLAESLLQSYPLLGSVVEVHTRFLGWLAYLLGGRAGQRLSLATRFVGARIAYWMLTAREKMDPGRSG